MIRLDGEPKGGVTLPPWHGKQDRTTQQQTAHSAFGTIKAVRGLLGGTRYGFQIDLPATRAAVGFDGFSRAQVIDVNRSLVMGADEFYTLEFLPDHGWKCGTGLFTGCELWESWQHYAPPALAIQAHDTYVGFVSKTGPPVTNYALDHKGKYVSAVGAPKSGVGVTRLPDCYMVPPSDYAQGVVHQYIVRRRVTMTVGVTGVLEGWYRFKGAKTFKPAFSLTGYPTVQYDPHGGVGSCFDVVQAYRGPSTAPVTVKVGGYSRSDSFAEAAAFLP